MFDLPEHLSSLNALASPNAPMDQSAEDAVWNYLNTDELFRNFGVQPSEFTSKIESPPKLDDKRAPADLKSFIEQFASDNNNTYTPEFSALNMPFSAPPSTPAGVNTADVMPNIGSSSWAESPDVDIDGRASGAKRLKQMGAGQAEIEEDKRRRNTEASARFRAKKKEREQILERRAKELEAQVARLSADKASLENENKLLKAIVLGGNSGSAVSETALAQLVNAKRKRE